MPLPPPPTTALAASWGAPEVQAWVGLLGGLTDQERAAFRENEVDGEDLLALRRLGKAGLRDDLGLTRLKARNIVMAALEALPACGESSSQPLVPALAPAPTPAAAAAAAATTTAADARAVVLSPGLSRCGGSRATADTDTPATHPAGRRWWSGRWGSCVVVAVVAGCYANALEGGWQVDDLRSFAGNRDVVGQLMTTTNAAGETAEASKRASASGKGQGGREALPPPPPLTPGVKGDPYLPSCGLKALTAAGGGVARPPEGSWLRLAPLPWQLLTDDFWGEPIASPNSHKSYRPLTVLSFRLSHWLFNHSAAAARDGEGDEGVSGGGGGGESFLRVHWVAVPQVLRARRVNRRR
jgi:hypothetical protein